MRKPYQGHRDRLESALAALGESHCECRGWAGVRGRDPGRATLWIQGQAGVSAGNPWERCFVGAGQTSSYSFPGRLKRDIGLNPTSVIFELWSPEKVVPIPGFNFLDDEVETRMLCLLLEEHFTSGRSQLPEQHLPSSLSCPGRYTSRSRSW